MDKNLVNGIDKKSKAACLYESLLIFLSVN